MHVRRLNDMDETNHTNLHDGVLTPDEGRVSIGDADSEIVVSDLEQGTGSSQRHQLLAPT